MNARPIIFSAPMVRALLDGRKTQTRRLATSPLAKVKPGDLLWVRETWRTTTDFDGRSPQEIARKCLEAGYRGPRAPLKFDAGGPEQDFREGELGDWSKRGRSSIHMPRWASRLTLEVTGVRLERLNDISEADAIAEGCKVIREHCYVFDGTGYDRAGLCHGLASTAFAILWETLHDKPGARWEDNPTVVAITFTVHRHNVDELVEQREAA